ncbi:MAG: right-handed parallel beta-helix repeat-containing protein [Bacteroidales bacterium]|nr:right-handed parallel beta-helix repeat-containing protein [Bacteroidales bacterium]
MKNFHKISVMMMICFFIAYSAFADVTVDGFCYLEGETDHSGTKVLFNAVSPSAVTDSVYTNADGSYLIELALGIYTVHFSHTDWLPYTIPGELLFFENTTLDDVVLALGSIVEVSGPQSGVWASDYSYHVIDDISVSEGETLTIEPGVTIKFMDFYSFNIYGTLIASGTESDSIFFTSGQSSCNQGDWDKIKFEDSSNDNSIIFYVSIEYSNCGIFCDYSSPTLTNNTINNNKYGIYCSESSPLIKNNTFCYNYNQGIYCNNSSSPIILNNFIRYNGSGEYFHAGILCRLSTSPTIINNTIINNNFDGIKCDQSCYPIIDNNTINNNYENGICCEYSSPTINNNIIHNNNFDGIYCAFSSPTINNNTICNNNYSGIYIQTDSSPTIFNNIIYENNTGIEAIGAPLSLEYNLFWENETTAIGDFLPVAFGVIITVNANGDPCDAYYNLFMDPLFVDPGNFDFHLTENSPCIDAGDPDPVYYDPDGTIADIGAFYFEQSQVSQQVFLSSGFSFVSSYIIPDNPDMLIVMATVLNENLDFVRNSQGQTLRKIGPNWVNGIGDWVVTEGYLVKMFTDDSFIIEGDAVDPATPIPVATGFQFVSYFPENPMNALLAFETLIGDDLDFIRNSQGQMIRKIGPNWVNGIGDCQSGEGYLIKMYADGELVYPVSAKSSGKINVFPIYFSLTNGNPADPVYTIYAKGFSIGDEIGIYNEEKLAGSGIVVSDNILENAIPVFSNLYEAGNKPIIKVWDKSENKEYVLNNYSFSNPYGDAWKEDVFPAIDGEYSLMNFSATGILDENMLNKISIYPNPSKGVFNISLQGNEGYIQIKVLDIKGKEYSNFELNNVVSTQIDLSDLPAGVYFISFSGKEFSQVKKIVIQ